MFGERAAAGGSDLHVSAERRLHVVGSPDHLRRAAIRPQLLLLPHLRLPVHPRHPHQPPVARLRPPAATFHQRLQLNRPSSRPALH